MQSAKYETGDAVYVQFADEHWEVGTFLCYVSSTDEREDFQRINVALGAGFLRACHPDCVRPVE